MKYVDGFVIPVPTKNLAAYQKMAKAAGKIWMEHGALQYFECVGDDLQHKGGPAPASFTKTINCKRGETVVFSYIVYKSRAHRDKVNAKVMADPRLQKIAPKEAPFDMKRMLYGGFKTLVEL